MAYAELKEKLEMLLTEDLSNRSSLQDVRRNLFLNNEGAKVQQQLISEKQGEIGSLNLLVEKKKTLLQLKDDEIQVLKGRLKELEDNFLSAEVKFEAERKTFAEKITALEELSTERTAALEEQVASKSGNESKISELSIKNEEFSAKIRELIYHIDSQNSEIESLKKEVADKSQSSVQLPLFEEKENEVARLQEKSDLLFESESRLKTLVSSQNNEIETLNKQSNIFKKQIEDISSGWQQQHEQLLSDNSNLLAELALVKEASLHTPEAAAETVSEVTVEEIAQIKAEKEHLSAELEAIKHELDVTTQKREEKIMLLQTEISNLQNHIISLSASLNQEAEQKNEISNQLEQLTSIITEKESQLHNLSNNTADEEFVDKLMQQINLLNEQKNSFETLYQDSEAELNLTKANLATLTQLVDGQKNSISDLEETNKHVKLAQTLVLQVKDKTVTKQAINELVREIDRCIALLSE